VCGSYIVLAENCVFAWPFIYIDMVKYNSRLVCKSLIVVIGLIYLHANNGFLNGDIVKKVCDMK